MTSPRLARVPCNGCTACCQNDLIMLHPEMGDDPTRYACHPAVNPITGQPGWALDHKPGGGCVYLGEAGCTIHPAHPAICREFDCGVAYANQSRATRRRYLAGASTARRWSTPGAGSTGRGSRRT